MVKASKLLVQIAFAVVALSAIYSAKANAFPTPDEMRANYQMCLDSDESWYRRFGQYVVAFDIYEATNVCNSQMQNQRTHLAPCQLSSGWVYAGYYCEEISGNPVLIK